MYTTIGVMIIRAAAEIAQGFVDVIEPHYVIIHAAEIMRSLASIGRNSSACSTAGG